MVILFSCLLAVVTGLLLLFIQTTLHEAAHALVFSMMGARITKFHPFPTRDTWGHVVIKDVASLTRLQIALGYLGPIMFNTIVIFLFLVTPLNMITTMLAIMSFTDATNNIVHCHFDKEKQDDLSRAAKYLKIEPIIKAITDSWSLWAAIIFCIKT